MTKRLTPDGIKNVPISMLMIVFLHNLFFAMAASVVFSYLPRLVKYFGASEEEAGLKVGIIGSSVYVGRFLTSMLWGFLVDTIGKKNTAMLAGTCLALTTIDFAVSRSVWLATLTRFLQGCSMGQPIIAKAILADFCDDSNMSFGISIVMTARLTGELIGPSLGGFLVFPCYYTTLSRK